MKDEALEAHRVLRPFREHLDRGPGMTMLEVTGSVASDAFVVSVMGFEARFEAITIGEDKHGPYAVVGDDERVLPNGFKLRVEVEPDELLAHGTAISITFAGEVRAELENRFREFNLVAPYERAFTVYFSADGRVNGRSEVGRPEPSHTN